MYYLYNVFIYFDKVTEHAGRSEQTGPVFTPVFITKLSQLVVIKQCTNSYQPVISKTKLSSTHSIWFDTQVLCQSSMFTYLGSVIK